MATFRELSYVAADRTFRFAWPEYSKPSFPPPLQDFASPHNIEAFVITKCSAACQRALEIGTHFGFFSSLIANNLRGPDGRLLGVELMPQNAQIANYNLSLNGLAEKGIVVAAAAAESEEKECLRFDIHAENSNLLGNSSNAIHGIGIGHAASLTLPRLLRGFGPFDILKMDIEGYESFILPSLAEGVIEAFDIVCLELHVDFIKHKFNKDAKESLSRFAPQDWFGFGLVCEHAPHPHVLRVEDIELDKYRVINFFFFRRAGKHLDLGEQLFEQCRAAR